LRVIGRQVSAERLTLTQRAIGSINVSAAEAELGGGRDSISGDLPRIVSAEVLPELSATDVVLQRVLDVVVATVAALLLIVPALIIALLVKTTSKGPVLFRQERVGVGGKLFNVWKFRTMADGTHAEVLADDELSQAYRDNDFKLSPNDPRITRIGRILRSTSLDEVPKLVNVLAGHMSIVGIRPLLAEELALRPVYDQDLYRRMRPGMTGLWQVEGRSTVQNADRLHLDRRYLEDWSVLDDVKIILRTPLALLRVAHAH